MGLIDLVNTQDDFIKKFQTKPLSEMQINYDINKEADKTPIPDVNTSNYNMDKVSGVDFINNNNADGFVVNQKETSYKYDTSTYSWVGDKPPNVDFFSNENASGFNTFSVANITDYNVLSSRFSWNTNTPPEVDFFKNYNSVGFTSFAEEFDTFYKQNTSKFVWKTDNIPSTNFFLNTNADGFTIFGKPKQTLYKSDTSDFVWKADNIPSTDFFTNENAEGFTIFNVPLQTEYIQDTSRFVWAGDNIPAVNYILNTNATGFTLFAPSLETEYIQDTSRFVWAGDSIPSTDYFDNVNATGFTLFAPSLETEYIEDTSNFVWKQNNIFRSNFFKDDDAIGFTLFNLLKETNFIMDTSDYVWVGDDIPETDFFKNYNADGFITFSPIYFSYYKQNTSFFVWKDDDIPATNYFPNRNANGFTLFAPLKVTDFIMNTSNFVWVDDDIPTTDFFNNFNADGFILFSPLLQTYYKQDTSLFVWSGNNIPFTNYFANINATGFTLFAPLKVTEYIQDTSQFVWVDDDIPSTDYFNNINATGFTIFAPLKVTEYIQDTSLFVWAQNSIPSVNYFPNVNATGFTLFAPIKITEYIEDTSLFVWVGDEPQRVNFFANRNAYGFRTFAPALKTDYFVLSSRFRLGIHSIDDPTLITSDFFNNKYANGFVAYKKPKETDFNLSNRILYEQYNKFELTDTSYQIDWMKQPYIVTGVQDDGNPNRYGLDDTYLFEPLTPYISRAVTDTKRIGKYLVSAKGLIYTIKQTGLQFMNPAVEMPPNRIDADNFLDSIVNVVEGFIGARQTQIYNPLSPLVATSGVKIQRHGFGFGFFGDKNNYEEVTKLRNNFSIDKTFSELDYAKTIDDQGNHNRLLMLMRELMPNHYNVTTAYLNPNGSLPSLSSGGATGIFNRVREFVGDVLDTLADPIAMLTTGKYSFTGEVINKISTRSTGPQSLYGIGATYIRRYSISEDEGSIAYQYYSPYFQYYSRANTNRNINGNSTQLVDEHRQYDYEDIRWNKSLLSKFMRDSEVEHNNHKINTSSGGGGYGIPLWQEDRNNILTYQYYSPYMQYYSKINNNRNVNGNSTGNVDSARPFIYEDLENNKSLLSKFIQNREVEHNNHKINTDSGNDGYGIPLWQEDRDTILSYQYYSPYMQYYSRLNNNNHPKGQSTKNVDVDSQTNYEDLQSDKSLISKFLRSSLIDHNNHTINTQNIDSIVGKIDPLQTTQTIENLYTNGLDPLNFNLKTYDTTTYNEFGFNRNKEINPNGYTDFRQIILTGSLNNQNSTFFNYNYDPNIIDYRNNSNNIKYGWASEGIPGMDKSDPRKRTYREDKINMIKVTDFSQLVNNLSRSNILSRDASELYNQGSKDYVKFFITCAGLMFDRQYDNRGTLLDRNEGNIEPSVYTQNDNTDTYNSSELEIQNQQSTNNLTHLSKLGYHAIVMRAFINSITENHNANWNSYNLIGRADPVYIYKSYDRNLTLSFNMHAFSRFEMQVIYEKINYLASMLAPVYKDGRMWGPLTRLTLGDLYWQVPGFITNLTYTFTEGNWETAGLKGEDDILELPMGVRVDMNYTIIGNYKPRKMGRIYDFVENNINFQPEPVPTDDEPEPYIDEEPEQEDPVVFDISYNTNQREPINLSEIENLKSYIKQRLRENPNASFDIEGHASIDGPSDLNEDLAFDRANGIVTMILGDSSIPITADRVRAVGYGERALGQRVITVREYPNGKFEDEQNTIWDNGELGTFTDPSTSTKSNLSADSTFPKNFSPYEFRSNKHNKPGYPVVEVPNSLYSNLIDLTNNLQVLRDELKSSITINSGYRTPEYNASVGGATNSQHLYARAADITVSGYTPQQVYDTIESLISQGKMKQGGLGLYTTFVHYDVRGNRQRWTDGSD